MPRSTKIVATLGPASSDSRVLTDLVAAGIDVVRLNFSHGSPDDHRERVETLRAVMRKIGRTVGVMADLQGPKIRIGKFAGRKVLLKKGQPFILDPECRLGDSERVGLDYPELVDDVAAGDVLLLDDGRIVMDIDEVEDGEIRCTVRHGGELSNNKGINKQGGGLSAPALTPKDMEDIRTAADLRVDFVAVSFPKSGDDMRQARALLTEAGSTALLVAKIERVEAIANLDEILDATDGVMVARGDLAVEVGDAAVPGLQKRIIRAAREHNKFVITATQMMESMIQNPVPTRAEVSDVANAVLDGTDAVMLSAETAAGKYPVETIEQMAAIAIAAERAEETHPDTDFSLKQVARIDQAIAMGALFTAHHLGCKAILALTESGSTTLWMSRYRIDVPIYGLTSQTLSQRKMALYRNVRSILMPKHDDRDAALKEAEALLVARGVLKPGDTYAITCGEPMGYPGGTNMLKVCRVG